MLGSANDQIGADVSRDGTSATVSSDTGAYADNDDIWKKRFVKRGMSRLRRRIRRVWALIGVFFSFVNEFRNPKLTRAEKIIMLQRFRKWHPEELENYRRGKTNNDLFDFHRVQAKLIETRIIEVLTNLGFCMHITKGEKKFIKKRIAVVQVDVSPFAYTYHLGRMPFGVRVTEIAQDWVGTELAASIGKKVRYDLDLEGLRFTVEVGSTLSIPNFVGFGDLDDVHKMPQNLPPLSFWVGLSSNGAPVYRNLAEAPHMIIAGSSGGGKSNMENTIACTLLHRNKPERLRVVFFDLKGGVEFDQYNGLPHLYPMKDDKWSTTGIVEFPSDVIPALNYLFKECMTRLGKLKKAGVKNIHEYNRKKRTNTMPYIVVFFDEWASTKKLVGAEAESLLSNIANISRAAGIHFLLATQYPKAEIINTTISVNFPWRLAFNMPAGASQSVLGDWGAVGLSPVGRAVMLTMDGQLQIQTPRITNQNVLDIVEEARTGIAITRNMQNVDAQDILEWSLTKAGMKLDHDSVFNEFREKIAREELRAILRDMEGKIYEVQGLLYKVIPGVGTLSRRMILADEAGAEASKPAHGAPHTSENIEIEEETPEIMPEPRAHVKSKNLLEDDEEAPKETENLLNPRTCEHCGAQTFETPCSYCGKYEDDEKEIDQ